MNDPQYNDNMDELYEMAYLLKDTGIHFERIIHPALGLDAKSTTAPGVDGDPLKFYDWMVKQFGHCILGKYQFLYRKDGKRISCIRSGVSFGEYEIGYDDPKGVADFQVERFSTAAETFTRIKELLA